MQHQWSMGRERQGVQSIRSIDINLKTCRPSGNDDVVGCRNREEETCQHGSLAIELGVRAYAGGRQTVAGAK